MPGADEVFNEVELVLDEHDKKPLAAPHSDATTKTKPKRKPLPAALPRVDVIVDIDESDKVCDCCQSPLHKMGESSSEALEFVPAHIKVIKTIRPKYACRQCERNGIESVVKTALMPGTPIPKSKLGEAISYNLNQFDKFQRYLEDGRLSIDNNRAERAIKPFVIERKAWLFSNTCNGAHASAILYSLVETAKANGLVVHDYISICLQHIAEQPTNLEPLLPWNIKRS